MIQVAAGVLWHEGRVLLGERRHPAGRWEFPGGKVEPGESAPECLVRELREELAIEVHVGRLIAEVRQEIHLFAYEVTWVGGSLEVLDHVRVAWVLPNELARYALMPGDVAVAREVIDQF